MIQFDLAAVESQCRGLKAQLVRAALRDGSDHPPIRPGFLGRPGNSPSLGAIPKWKVDWRVEQHNEQDWVGFVTWHLLGYSGSFPAVSESIPITKAGDNPTFFPSHDLAEQCAADCARALRQQFVAYWSEREPGE